MDEEIKLTKAEEQVMKVLWRLGKGFVKDIVENIPGKGPAYNTVSTVVRTLERKGAVSHTKYGNTYEYYPLIKKEEYSKQQLNTLVSDYFGGSFKQLLSFFAKENDPDIHELDDIKNFIESELKNRKNDDA